MYLKDMLNMYITKKKKFTEKTDGNYDVSIFHGKKLQMDTAIFITNLE